MTVCCPSETAPVTSPAVRENTATASVRDCPGSPNGTIRLEASTPPNVSDFSHQPGGPVNENHEGSPRPPIRNVQSSAMSANDPPGVPPLPVIEDLNILRDLASSLLSRVVAPVMHQFVLQRAPKTFHRGIVVTVPPPTHGRGHAKLADLILIVVGTILRATIGAMD